MGTMRIFFVVPRDQFMYPLTGCFDIPEGFVRVGWRVFQLAKRTFRIGAVITHRGARG